MGGRTQNQSLMHYLFVLSLLCLISVRISVNVGFTLTPVYFVNVIMLLLLMQTQKGFFISKKLLSALVPVTFFYIYCCFTAIYAPDSYLSLRFILGTFFFLLTVYTHVIFFYKNNLNLRSILCDVSRVYILVSFFLYILGFYAYGNVAEGSVVFGVLKEKGLPRAVGLFSDPNFAALTFIVLMFFSMKFVIKYRRLYIYISFFLIVATLSRGALIALFFIFVVFNFYSIKHLIYSTIIVVLLYPVSYVLYDNFAWFTNVVDKRIAGAASGSGRFDMWYDAYTLFVNAPIFGYGIFNFRYLNELFFNNTHFAHNTYVEVLVETGLVGFCFFLIMLFTLACLSFSRTDNTMMKVFFSMLVMAVSLSLYLNPAFLFLVIVFFCSYLDKNKSLV